MEREQAIDFLRKRMRQFTSFQEDELEDILSQFTLTELKSKTILNELGSVAKKVYFIINGSMRFFYDYNDKEITGAIFMDNEFVTPHESFISQKPSRYALQVIEDTIALQLTYSDNKRLVDKYPAFNELRFRILERALSVTLTNKSRLLTMTHEERYAKIYEDKPEWILRIPDHILASYLGITPNSLSRIKRRLVK